MKIRQGFVSNSSTTSFCIYGAWVDPPKPTLEQEEDEDFDAYEDMYEVCENNGLECHHMDGMSSYAVGLSPMDMGLDETRKEFQDRVEESIMKLFKLNTVDAGWIEEAYYS